MTLNSNQFNITNEVGALSLLQNINVMDVIVTAAESGTLVPGNALVITDITSKKLNVQLATASTDKIFGFVPTDVLTSEWVATDITKVAFTDCVMIMQASAAIATGAALQYDPATNKVATATGENTVIGKALGKATADTDLIQVLIQTPALGSLVTATVAELNILDGVIATAAEINYLDLTGAVGVQEASKAVVADANVNTGVSKVTELHIGTSGAEVEITATAAELNKSDISAEDETIDSGVAASITKTITRIDNTTSGAGAITLAAPTAIMLGRTKVIEMTVDNGDVTLSLANVAGGSAATTCTWDAVGEALVLIAGVAKWNVVSEGGVTLS